MADHHSLMMTGPPGAGCRVSLLARVLNLDVNVRNLQAMSLQYFGNSR